MDLVAEMAVLNPFDFFLEPYAETFPFGYQGAEKRDLAPYLVMFRGEPLFKEYLAHAFRASANAPSIFWSSSTRSSRSDIKYLIRMEPGVQTPELTLTKRSGSCRDSAWLLVQLLRHMGLAARFVSGYLIQLTADMKSLDGPSGPEKDFTDLHAWCEVYLPGAGWIGLDPTSGLLAGEGHIPLACTPEPGAAAPVTGAVDKAEVEFEHHMKVERIWEAPRVTKPYTEEQWTEIEKLGHAIDAQLLAGDVRLTMGGEPTFVSVDDPDGAEWNTTAMGPDKRRLAIEVYNRLKQKYAPQGLSHFGQGKWYPGEQLPRWSLNCFWRRDGEPIWHEPGAARRREAGSRRHAGRRRRCSSPASPSDWGCAPEHMFAAFEDAFYYLWRERQLPSNVDPFKSKLEDPQERARLAKVFEQGLDTVIGHVLPVSRDASGDALAHRLLVPAARALLPDSGRFAARATGCRSIRMPWVKKDDYPYMYEPDPMAPPRPLPRAAEIRRQFMRRDARRSRREAAGNAAAPRPRRASARGARWRRGAGCRAGFLQVRDRDHAHRHVRRAAQRRSLYIHAADRQARGLPGAGRRGRSHRRSHGYAGGARRLRAAEGSAPQPLQRDAGSGRHRGEHPSVGQLG